MSVAVILDLHSHTDFLSGSARLNYMAFFCKVTNSWDILTLIRSKSFFFHFPADLWQMRKSVMTNVSYV